MPGQPIIASADDRISAQGRALAIHEWRGSGPSYLHVHNSDDEAWHVLEGELQFRFADRSVVVAAGGTVFVPAGVPHTYQASSGARYLVFLTARLNALIAELQRAPGLSAHAEIMTKYESEIVE